MVIHFLPAISAEYESCQRICLSKGILAPGGFPQLLYQFPCLFVNNGFMGVFKNQPCLLRITNAALILIGFFVRTEIYSMPDILRLRQNLTHHITAPIIGSGKVFFAFPKADPFLA